MGGKGWREGVTRRGEDDGDDDGDNNKATRMLSSKAIVTDNLFGKSDHDDDSRNDNTIASGKTVGSKEGDWRCHTRHYTEKVGVRGLGNTKDASNITPEHNTVFRHLKHETEETDGTMGFLYCLSATDCAVLCGGGQCGDRACLPPLTRSHRCRRTARATCLLMHPVCSRIDAVHVRPTDRRTDKQIKRTDTGQSNDG